MIRVMIVDDEYIVRLGISSLLDWESHGYTVCATAVDGSDALSKIPTAKPDIILADILMNPMGGLELLEKCVVQYPQIKFIMLSNSTDFHFVKKAMQLGACDYIFKLEINSEDLLKALNSVNIPVSTSNEDMFYVKHNLFESLLSGEVFDSSHVNPVIQQFTLCRKYDHFRFLLIEFQCNSTASDNLFSLSRAAQNIIEQFTASMPDSICMWIRDLFFGVVFFDSGDIENYAQICKRINEYAQRYISCTAICALSDCCDSFSAFSPIYAATQLTLEQYFYSPLGCFFSNSISFENKYRHKDLVDDSKLISGVIIQSEISKLQPAVDSLLTSIISRNYAPDVARHYLYALLEHIKLEISQQFQCDDSMLSIQFSFDSGKLLSARNYAELTKLFFALLSELHQVCHQHSSYPEIYIIKKYIEDNITRKITLSEAAQLVNISESYFSHLFKKETGISFIDYVNEMKIRKACSILSLSSMKVNEIASYLGFNNPNYFNILFKRLTGVTPGNYREKALKGDNDEQAEI